MARNDMGKHVLPSRAGRHGPWQQRSERPRPLDARTARWWSWRWSPPAPCFASSECSSHMSSQFVHAQALRCGPHHHQVGTGCQPFIGGFGCDRHTEAAAHTVPLDGRTDRSSRRVGHPRWSIGQHCSHRIPLGGEVDHGDRSVRPGAPVTSERLERPSLADPPDQADRRRRPFRRRDWTMRRPALVDMRWRKPWRRARLRTLGWYVRFTKCLLGRGPRPSAGAARPRRRGLGP